MLHLYLYVFPSVHPQMSYRLSICRENFITLNALVWFFSGVFHHMDFDMLIVQLSYVTPCAFKWFLTRMGPQMTCKNTFSLEIFNTIATVILK